MLSIYIIQNDMYAINPYIPVVIINYIHQAWTQFIKPSTGYNAIKTNNYII
jgi:hypothetical protein